MKHFWNGNYQSYLHLKLISRLGKAQTQYLNKVFSLVKYRKNWGSGEVNELLEDISVICETRIH